MLKGKGILSDSQRTFLHFFANLPDQEHFYLTGGTALAGFDLYWFAVALNRTKIFPDEIERWPVKMLVELDPVTLKRQFQNLAMKILAENTGKP